MSNVVPITAAYACTEAKARGVLAAVNIAARQLGYSEHLAYRAGRKAARMVRERRASPAMIVAMAKRELRDQREPEVA
ncbi:hypothetical protein [Coralloluteibacterium thermophilus]|uniref:Uncharacterized protein n=1 Tax=Coralloluteibacterium thermophilum TaxID=2707049 RepID=A0ABV9NLP1_9GAMM